MPITMAALSQEEQNREVVANAAREHEQMPDPIAPGVPVVEDEEQNAILAYGFARARGDECGHDFLVPFSCKGRAVCPACNTRRKQPRALPIS